MLGGRIGYEDPDNPSPPGPWDPVIRNAFEQTTLRLGPFPDPWRTSRASKLDWVALNPQPLPPRTAFLVELAKQVADRGVLMQEVADNIHHGGEQQGIIIVGGYFSSFVDFVCGSVGRPKFPFPPPKGVDGDRLSPLELLTMAAVFEDYSQTVVGDSLRQELSNTGAKLSQAALPRV
jgi:hypothetical protein